MKKLFFLTILTALLVAVPSVADLDNDDTVIVTLTSRDGDRLTVEGPDGEMFLTWPGADFDNGEHLVVKLDETGNATEIVTIEDRVDVVGEMQDDLRAVTGSVASTSTEQLIVKTMTGETAFVINPEKLFPPVPTPDDNVVVLYRVVERQGQDELRATQLVFLPQPLPAEPNVRVSYEPIEREVEQTVAEIDRELDETADQIAEEIDEEIDTETYADTTYDSDTTYESTYTRASLPQTAGEMPLLGLLSLLAIAGAFSLRAFRS